MRENEDARTTRQSLSYLFAVWEGGGNMPPTLAVIRRLLAAGHRVRVLGDPCQERDVTESGAEFRSWHLAPRRLDTLPESDPLRDWEFTQPGDLIGALRDKLLFGPAERYARDVAAELSRVQTDCVVSSDLLFGPAIAAEAAAIPCVFLAANVFLYPRPGVPPFGPGLLPVTNDADRSLARDIEAMSIAAFGATADDFNRARAAFGLPAVTHPFDQLERLRGILVLSSESFDFPSSAPSERIVFAGPELDDPAWAGSWSSPWSPSDTRPLVLVGLSSTFQNQQATLCRIACALAPLSIRAVITTGPAIAPDTIPVGENTHVCRTAPHSQILQHASAMITHAGHGSVMRGLAAGVPLLCLPMGRDQNDNAARVAYRNAGLRLGTAATEHEIATSLQQLLSDPSFRANAERLGSQLRRDFENSLALTQLESWARSSQKQTRAGDSARANRGNRPLQCAA